MRWTLFLAVFIISCQEIKGKEITEVLGFRRYEFAHIKHALQKRGVSDIWGNIENTANHAWDYIKNLAKNTKKKFQDWIAKMKDKARDLQIAFEMNLKKISIHIHEIINNIKKTGEVVKKCLQERKEEIDRILKNILIDVTNCISDSLNRLHNLSSVQYVPIPNQTEFMKSIQSDVNECMKKNEKQDEVEECVQTIRNGIYKKMDLTEDYMLRYDTEKRGATDDILNTIVGCTTDGIIKSTNIIANETIRIIECVSQG